jgi:hypothetical protein
MNAGSIELLTAQENDGLSSVVQAFCHREAVGYGYICMPKEAK